MIGRRLTALAAGLALTVTTALVAAAPASADSGKMPQQGTRSLAAVLAKDGSGFDRNWNDYDIVDNAVRAVLAANPDSPVAVLADGSVALTAFLPTDRAFRNLARGLTGDSFSSESAVFSTLAGALGVETIENVLLYHVVPGATVTYRQALRSDGAVLDTALPGATIKIKKRYYVFVQIVDQDPDAKNAWVVQPNINKGNRQIAHGISQVLRPVDL